MCSRIGTIVICVVAAARALADAPPPVLPEAPPLTATGTIAERRAYLETERVRLQKAGSNAMEWVNGGLITTSVGSGVVLGGVIGLLADTPSDGTILVIEAGGILIATGAVVAGVAFVVNVTEGVELAVVDKKLKGLNLDEEREWSRIVAAQPPRPVQAAGMSSTASDGAVATAQAELRAARWRHYSDRMDGADNWRTVGYIGMGAGVTVASYNWLYFRPTHNPYEPVRSYATYHAVMWGSLGSFVAGSVIAYAGDRSYDRLYQERRQTQLTLAPVLLPGGGTVIPGLLATATF